MAFERGDMRAAAFTGFGGPEHVTIESFDDPEPGPEEAVLEVEACSINHHDLWILNGDFWVGEDQLPYVAGMDVAGTVSAIGNDVEHLEAGSGSSCVRIRRVAPVGSVGRGRRVTVNGSASTTADWRSTRPFVPIVSSRSPTPSIP